MRELADYTPAQFRESRVAARLNGYVSRRGNFVAEISSLGLSPAATTYLERVASKR